MSITAQTVFNLTMPLLDEIATEEDAVADYKERTPELLTILQNELLDYSDTYKTFSLSRVPINPVVSREIIVDYDEDNDNNIEAPAKAYAYYFESNGPGEAYIEESIGGSWVNLDTITITDTGTFTAYKGLITPSAEAISVRIRFGGNFYYNYTNVALYDKKFSVASKIPDYRPYIHIEMPANFKSISQVVAESYPSKYVKTVDYYWENESQLVINRKFEGEIRIIYRPVPIEVTSLDQELEVDANLAYKVLPFGLGALLMATENVSLGSFLQAKYEENKRMAKGNKPQPINNVEDLYDVTLSRRRKW